jgi:hypothetical protein
MCEWIKVHMLWEDPAWSMRMKHPYYQATPFIKTIRWTPGEATIRLDASMVLSYEVDKWSTWNRWSLDVAPRRVFCYTAATLGMHLLPLPGLILSRGSFICRDSDPPNHCLELFFGFILHTSRRPHTACDHWCAHHTKTPILIRWIWIQGIEGIQSSNSNYYYYYFFFSRKTVWKPRGIILNSEIWLQNGIWYNAAIKYWNITWDISPEMNLKHRSPYNSGSDYEHFQPNDDTRQEIK